MAQYADVCVIIWDGESNGSQDMLKRARKHGLQVYVYNAITEEIEEY